ncbi:MAG: hypothetical protein K5629_02895 [Eubacteriales bacterium]|nr:hypothetical protein [Eubacteriales bacterium]
MTDIPLEEAENGYKILLPEETWDIVIDEKMMLFENVVDKTEMSCSECSEAIT